MKPGPSSSSCPRRRESRVCEVLDARLRGHDGEDVDSQAKPPRWQALRGNDAISMMPGRR
ncbi:MAG: hypothetical protein ACYCOY_11820 [Metallibacterium sp.]